MLKHIYHTQVSAPLSSQLSDVHLFNHLWVEATVQQLIHEILEEPASINASLWCAWVGVGQWRGLGRRSCDKLTTIL